jgi:site-specific recombinase XerD
MYFAITFATHFVVGGDDIRSEQGLLGHADADISHIVNNYARRKKTAKLMWLC